MATKRVATQIRLDEELYDKLKAIAEAEKRSLNNLMEYFLLQGVELYSAEK